MRRLRAVPAIIFSVCPLEGWQVSSGLTISIRMLCQWQTIDQPPNFQGQNVLAASAGQERRGDKMLWRYWGVLLSWYTKMKRKAIESSLQHAQPKWVFSVFSHPVKIQFISRSHGIQEALQEFNTRKEVRRNISLWPLLSPQAYRKCNREILKSSKYLTSTDNRVIKPTRRDFNSWWQI